MIETWFGKVWSHLEIATVILLSVSPLISQSAKIMLVTLLIGISILDCHIHNKRVYFERHFILLIAFFIVSMLLDFVNVFTSNQSYSIVNLLYPYMFLCGYLLTIRYEKAEFYETFERIMFVFAILSLLGMLLYYSNPAYIQSLPTYEFNQATHRTVYFFNYLFVEDWMVIRNTGIAWEPGLFQILLNMAMQIAIMKQSGHKLIFRLIVYVIAIVLTHSTIGYFILLVNLISLIIKDKRYIFLLIPSVALASSFIMAEISYQLEFKWAGTSAFDARFYPSINALKYAWYMPLGIGSTGYDMIYKAENIGSFDCYTQILMRYGYPVLVCIIGRLIKIFKKDGAALAIILIVGYLSEPIWATILFVMMYYIKDVERGGSDQYEIRTLSKREAL